MSTKEPAPSSAVPAWLRRLVHVMDDLIPIPGTGRGVGLDAIVGFLLPGAGDALTALTTLALIAVAVKLEVPGVVVARMVLQQVVDLVVGAIPVAGDVFDALNRANRRNLELIERHAHDAAVPTWADRAFVALAVVVGVALVVLPFVLAFELIALVRYLFAGTGA